MPPALVVNPHNEPQWQDDEDATECFICSTKYSFFYRRHHCRRCGRVVCGACSQTQTPYEAGATVVQPFNSLFMEPDYVPHRTCDVCVTDMVLSGILARDRFGELAIVENDQHDSTTSTGACPMEVPARLRKDTSEQQTTILDNGGDDDDDADSENDRCPICGVILRDKDEQERENHINTCLIEAEFSGSPEHPRSSNRMLVYYIPFPDTDKKVVVSCSDASNMSGQTSTQEKVLPNFEECVICLEDLKPGDKVGRLECLCVFHYKCIKSWFKRKGPGDCPVHAVHL
ncbi:E3 ubiquitin-protein ligase PIB1 [Cyberlindnera fabianii]|uniref:RING-type E3 ubiquitin transferase n=1 Tax=Cyberlindnera fabianii TaxID=36022 RepID=A0A1V2KZR8_CYBFA|nr:E3 ubiquitin-protein ligase PIB1 [Cyberlindnera fabianii]